MIIFAQKYIFEESFQIAIQCYKNQYIKLFYTLLTPYVLSIFVQGMFN